MPLSGFIAFLRFYTVLRRDSQAFEYLPDDANSTLIAPILRQIEELGGRVITGRTVTELRRTENQNGWRVQWKATNGSEETGQLEAPYVVLAADASGTARLLQNSEPTREIAAELKWPAWFGDGGYSSLVFG